MFSQLKSYFNVFPYKIVSEIIFTCLFLLLQVNRTRVVLTSRLSWNYLEFYRRICSNSVVKKTSRQRSKTTNITIMNQNQEDQLMWRLIIVLHLILAKNIDDQKVWLGRWSDILNVELDLSDPKCYIVRKERNS